MPARAHAPKGPAHACACGEPPPYQLRPLRFARAWAFSYLFTFLPPLLRAQRLGWGDAEACRLAVVLPLCGQLRRLELVQNSIGDAGLVALAEALSRHGKWLVSLEQIRLSFNAYGAVGMRALAKCLSHRKRLPSLRLLKVSVQHEQLQRVCRARGIQLFYEGSRARLLATKDSHSGDLQIFGTETDDSGAAATTSERGDAAEGSLAGDGTHADADVGVDSEAPTLAGLRSSELTSTSSIGSIGSRTFSRIFGGIFGGRSESSVVFGPRQPGKDAEEEEEEEEKEREEEKVEQAGGGGEQAETWKPPRRLGGGHGGTASSGGPSTGTARLDA
jgi:hypothetical protein